MRTVLFVAVALLTAGCGDASAPSAPPLPVASAAPSPTAYSPAPLPAPKETAGVDREVEQAVLAYFAGINALLGTGDRTAFDATYGPDCASCAAFSAKVADMYAQGQTSDARDEVLSLEVAGGNSPDAGAATVTYRVRPYRVLAADGSEVGSYPESRTTQIFTVARIGGTLRVVGIQDVSS